MRTFSSGEFFGFGISSARLILVMLLIGVVVVTYFLQELDGLEDDQSVNQMESAELDLWTASSLGFSIVIISGMYGMLFHRLFIDDVTQYKRMLDSFEEDEEAFEY